MNVALREIGKEPFILDVQTAADYIALPEPGEDALLLGPLVRRGERTIVVGDTGHGKTTLTLQFLEAILTGADVFDYTGIGRGPVLWLDLEQGLRTIKRGLREARLDGRHDALVVSVPDGLDLSADLEHQVELERIIYEHEPTALALDPYYKAARIDNNEETPVIELMRNLDRLRAQYGFALIMPAHPRKDIPGRDGPRKLTIHDVAGSGAITRGAEIVLGIERLHHGAGRLRILKDRDGDLQVGDAWNLLFDRDRGFRLDPKDKQEERDLLEAILADAATLRTRDEWAAHLKCRPSTTLSLLEHLMAEGKIQMVSGSTIGRSPRGKFYGTSPNLWDESGRVASPPAETGNSSHPSDLSLRDRSVGTSRTAPPELVPNNERDAYLDSIAPEESTDLFQDPT